MESNHMTCYALSSRGGREANEDSVAVARSPFAALCVLADGLGGLSLPWQRVLLFSVPDRK